MSPAAEVAPPVEAAPIHVRFEAGGELYALPLLQVREVVIPQGFTRVPRAPGHLVGVMNHHGRVIGVVDLAALTLGGASREPAFVVLLDHPRRQLGLGVDAVDGVGPLEVQGDVARLEDRAVTVLSREAVLAQVDDSFAHGPVVKSDDPGGRKES